MKCTYHPLPYPNLSPPLHPQDLPYKIKNMKYGNSSAPLFWPLRC